MPPEKNDLSLYYALSGGNLTDGSGGYIVTFLQAARIEGMKYDIEMVYEDGNPVR